MNLRSSSVPQICVNGKIVCQIRPNSLGPFLEYLRSRQLFLFLEEYLEDQRSFIRLRFYFDLKSSVSVRYTSCKNNIIN